MYIFCSHLVLETFFFQSTLKLGLHSSPFQFCLGPERLIIGKKTYWLISDKVFDKLPARSNSL